jgi:hypothetical protein
LAKGLQLLTIAAAYFKNMAYVVSNGLEPIDQQPDITRLRVTRIRPAIQAVLVSGIPLICLAVPEMITL